MYLLWLGLLDVLGKEAVGSERVSASCEILFCTDAGIFRRICKGFSVGIGLEIRVWYTRLSGRCGLLLGRRCSRKWLITLVY